MASINLQGDTSGSISISAPSVAGSNTLTLPATTQTLATQHDLGVRNLIINGDMRIDQRNNGSSATANTNTYFVDRLQLQASGAAPVLTGERVTDAPNGFKYSMKFTTNSTTDTLVANEAVTPRQNIEGYIAANLNFGNANAKEFTVSFWVKGSVTGTYGFSVMNASFNRHYVTTYNINSANTWEYKTITLTADTSGTWDTTTGTGVRIMFPIDTGSDLHTATTETWGTGDKRATASCVKLLQNSSATWQITGLQVELGDTATPFEHRPYDMELARCQRYCTVISGEGSSASYSAFGYGFNSSGTRHECICHLPTKMRATPSLTATASEWQISSVTTAPTATSIGIFGNQSSTNSVQVYADTSGLTQAYPGRLETKGSTTVKAILSAEL